MRHGRINPPHKPGESRGRESGEHMYPLDGELRPIPEISLITRVVRISFDDTGLRMPINMRGEQMYPPRDEVRPLPPTRIHRGVY